MFGYVLLVCAVDGVVRHRCGVGWGRARACVGCAVCMLWHCDTARHNARAHVCYGICGLMLHIGAQGGVAYLTDSSSFSAEHCTFTENTAVRFALLPHSSAVCLRAHV